MASTNNSENYLLFPWDGLYIHLYMYNIYFTFHIIHVRYINSPKICNHTVFIIKVVYLHCITWDGFCYLKMLPKPSPPSLPFDNIWHFWLEQKYFPGNRFKRIYIRNMLSGPFGTTRNMRNQIERALKKDKISRHYSINMKCYFTFAKWSTSSKMWYPLSLSLCAPSENFKECFQTTKTCLITLSIE
jgi:hypothetical protein